MGKSNITNLRKRYSEFLGFKFKTFLKGKKYVLQSFICDKAKLRIKKSLAKALDKMKSNPTVQTVGLYNSKVIGIQNYYQIATMISLDLAKIAYLLSRKLKSRIKGIESKTGLISELYRKRYKNKYKKHFVAGIILFPLQDIKNKPPINFNKEVCNYTEMGRSKIHNIAYINPHILKQLMIYPDYGQSALFNDNRISLYAGQGGRCGLTNVLLKMGNMEVHHIIPKAFKSSDKYQNLIYLSKEAHALVHYGEVAISMRAELYELIKSSNAKQVNRLQELRKLAKEREIKALL